ncbi:zinc ribbon domain-containing protein [Thermocaproicibacter melissae]|uniref:zinc ribbon domain-containing protein n=1 Tax=Thermocaproicibacter melissae TaxID=2966552 RepID=UPI003A0FEDBE
MAVVTCASQRFIFFFIPMFRFGKRYFISCPNCGSVYEISREVGKRLEHDPNAEVNPEKIFRLARRASHYCPFCGTAVPPGSRFCPHCGQKL